MYVHVQVVDFVLRDLSKNKGWYIHGNSARRLEPVLHEGPLCLKTTSFEETNTSYTKHHIMCVV